MKIKDLKKIIDSYADQDINVRIVVEDPYAVGGTPTVGVSHIISGFDWDNGKLMIFTDSPIKVISDSEKRNGRIERIIK